MGSHWISAVTRDGMRSGVNRIHFHLTSRAEWFHSAKTEWSDTGLPRCRVTAPPYPMRKAIRCVMNPVSCNWGRYVKFLGVLLDENLSWKYHLTELSKKLARTCGMFFKIRHFLPIHVLVCLYNSLFSPFLQYGILIWGLTYETHINPVFLLQQRAVRAISFEHYTAPSTPIFSDLKILKLQDLFHLKLLTFVYECVNKISPSCLHSFFELVGSVHQYGTRQVIKSNIFLTQKIPCNMVLGQYVIVELNAGKTFLLISNNLHLLVAFAKKSKPSYLKLSTKVWKSEYQILSPSMECKILVHQTAKLSMISVHQ